MNSERDRSDRETLEADEHQLADPPPRRVVKRQVADDVPDDARQDTAENRDEPKVEPDPQPQASNESHTKEHRAVRVKKAPTRQATNKTEVDGTTQIDAAPPAAAVQPAGELTAEYWLDRITPFILKGAEFFVRGGKELNAAKDRLPHGEFSRLVDMLKIRGGQRTAQTLMAIARNS